MARGGLQYTTEKSVSDTLDGREDQYLRARVTIKMILLPAEGFDNDEIAPRLDTRREIVRRWRKGFFKKRLSGFDEQSRSGRPRAFPPELVVEVKALAYELPGKLKVTLSLSRLSVADVTRYVRGSGLVGTISENTIWRWLDEDAIRPWQHRCWIFPRDPILLLKQSASSTFTSAFARDGL